MARARRLPGPATKHKQASTLSRLERRIHDHLIPGVGAVRVDHLRPEHVETWLQAESAAGLKRRTLIDYRGDLRQLLNWVIQRERLIAWNAASAAVIPADAAESTEKIALSREDRDRLFVALDDHRLTGYLSLIARDGLRPGEVDALRWSDLDLDECTMMVRHAMKRDQRGQALELGPTKTKRSSRALRIVEQSAALLRRRRAEQAAERLASGRAWTDDERWADLVFTTEIGMPLAPSGVRKTLTKACATARIPRVTPYELRHTAATIMADDLPLIRVADQLGHVDTRMIEQIYRHAPEVIDAGAEVERKRAAQ